MTSRIRVCRTLVISLVVALYAAAAAPQSATPLPDFDRGGHAAIAPAQNRHAAPSSVQDQISALDTRIEMLAMDMRMFSGELKVDVMASLLTAMIERQGLVEREMRTMRERMMRRMTERAAPPAPPIAAVDEEPGGMCAPSL